MRVRVTGITESPGGSAVGAATATPRYTVSLVDTEDPNSMAGAPSAGGFTLPLRDIAGLAVSAEYDLTLAPAEPRA